MIVDILNLGVGNTNSINHALKRLGVDANFVSKTNQLSSETLIIPGVGSARYFMERIDKFGFRQCLIDCAASGKRMIGICLGFQMLGQYSEEDGGVDGLGILSGRVEKLSPHTSHNGWECYSFDKKYLVSRPTTQLTLKRKLAGRVFYNHEYGFINKDDCFDQKIPGDLQMYSAVVIKDNVIGFQFHPEKSQSTGLDLFSMIL